jgi:hypothetical protein
VEVEEHQFVLDMSVEQQLRDQSCRGEVGGVYCQLVQLVQVLELEQALQTRCLKYRLRLPRDQVFLGY